MPFSGKDIVRLNPTRIANSLKLLGSYYRARMGSRVAISGMPLSISVEPTTACNLGCTECPSGLRQFTRPTGSIDLDLFGNVVDQLKRELVYMTLYFQGEPFIHRNFLDLVHRASEGGIYTSTSTNGHFLTEDTSEAVVRSGLDRLIISIDGTDQETYEKYRVNGNLETVLEGINNLEMVKRRLGSARPYTELQFIVFRHNEHQVAEMNALHAKLGADKLIYKTAQVYDFENKEDILPTDPTYSRYQRDQEGGLSIRNKLLNHCWRMWSGSVITWDGKVVPCCFDKDATHVLGDLSRDSFRDIWFGKAYNEFRSKLFVSRSEIDICTNCTEGTKVWA